MSRLDDTLPALEEPFLDAAAALRQWGFAQVHAEWKRLEERRPSHEVRRWLDYLEHGAEVYLRRYMFFLSTGRVPAVDEPALPELKTRR